MEEDEGMATTEKSNTQKWLGRIGTFLMMGGWLLVVVLVLGILILVGRK